MPVEQAAAMLTNTRPTLHSSYLLRVLAVPAGNDGYRYELHELRSGVVRNFASLAALHRHLGEVEAGMALSSVGRGECRLEHE